MLTTRYSMCSLESRIMCSRRGIPRAAVQPALVGVAQRKQEENIITSLLGGDGGKDSHDATLWRWWWWWRGNGEVDAHKSANRKKNEHHAAPLDRVFSEDLVTSTNLDEEKVWHVV